MEISLGRLRLNIAVSRAPEHRKMIDLTGRGKGAMTDSRQQSRLRAVDALTRDFLIWLEDAPRTYADAMEVWRTSCPRFSIWEDALADGLVQIASAPGR